MFEKEMEYRLAKYLLGCITHDKIINKRQQEAILEMLIEELQPSLKCLEVVKDIGDGVRVGEQ